MRNGFFLERTMNSKHKLLTYIKGEPKGLRTFPSNWVMCLGPFCALRSLLSSHLRADLGRMDPRFPWLLLKASLTVPKKTKLYNLCGSLQTWNIVNESTLDHHWKKIRIHKLEKIVIYYFRHWIPTKLKLECAQDCSVSYSLCKVFVKNKMQSNNSWIFETWSYSLWFSKKTREIILLWKVEFDLFENIRCNCAQNYCGDFHALF